MRRELYLMALLGLSTVSAACASQEKPAEQETVKEPEKKWDITIGQKTDKTVETVLKNELDAPIISVKIKNQSDKEFSENLLGTNESLEKGKTLQWFYEPSDATQTSTDEKKLNPSYSVELGLDNGETLTLNEFSFDDVKGAAEVHVKDGIAYLTYTSASTGEKVDTYEQEKAAADKAEAEKKQEEPVEAAKETEQSSQSVSDSQPVSEEPAYQEPVYQEPVYQEPAYQEPAITDPAPGVDVGSQGSEGCLGGDVVFNE